MTLAVLLMTAATGAWADDVNLGIRVKVWKTGDTFNIGDAWFYYNDKNDNYLHSSGTAVVPEFVYDSNNNQWRGAGNWIPCDQMCQGGTFYTSNGPQNIFITPPTGKNYQPLGVRVKSGSGTQADPYQFELLYDTDVIISDDSTEGTFTMPAFDATVEYEIVRDMSIDMPINVGDGTDGFVIRVKKDGESFVPSEMTPQEMASLITVTDNMEQKTLTNMTDYTVEIFAADDNGKPYGEAIAFASLTPGTYVAVATGMGAYDGTAQSNTFTLLEAYDLTLTPVNAQNPYNFGAANAKGSVTVEGQAVTPDANGKIKNIEPGKKVVLKTTGPDYIIRKASVKEKGAATPEGPTLAQTLTTANMTVKVYYTYSDTNNTCEFLSNGDGTYTFQSGTGYVGGNSGKAKALVVENGKLVFKQNFYATIGQLWNQVGIAITFDTSENTYSIWKGSNETLNPTLSKVEVNGTQIALTQQ